MKIEDLMMSLRSAYFELKEYLEYTIENIQQIQNGENILSDSSFANMM
jgi:hypothetical protein